MNEAIRDASRDEIWEMEATKGGEGTGEFEICPAGNYPATIVALIDVGTHEQENDKGELYDSRKLVIVVETTEKTSKGSNFFFSKMFTWSMRDNSNWYKLVCSLTGRKFADGERFDPRQVLGSPCMAMITNSKGTNKKGEDRTYANLDSIAQFPKGFPPPVERRPLISWSVKEGTSMPGFGWVPPIYGKSVEKLVNESKEFRQGKTIAPKRNDVADDVHQAIVDSPDGNGNTRNADVPF